MKYDPLSLILSLFYLISVAPPLAHAQSTSFLFLQIPSSPAGNGMGGIAGSIISDDPIGTLSNPAQLGLTSFDHYFTGEAFLSSNIDWSYGFS
jgi:hypothetical protein